MREGKEREGIGVRSFEVSLLCLMLQVGVVSDPI